MVRHLTTVELQVSYQQADYLLRCGEFLLGGQDRPSDDTDDQTACAFGSRLGRYLARASDLPPGNVVRCGCRRAGCSPLRGFNW